MLYIRKSLIAALAVVVAFISLLPLSAVRAAGSSTILQSSSGRTNITSGATLEKITRFTTDGWLSINVIRVDPLNPNIKVDTMMSPESIQVLATTQSIAKSKGAVAAINGGFFDWTYKTPIGTYVESGTIASASSTYDQADSLMASFSLNNLNEVLYNYWKINMELIAPNGNAIPIHKFNKPYDGSNKLTVIDGRWSRKTIGTDSPAKYEYLTEMIVVDGKVAEIRQNQPATSMPENGYAVVTRYEGTQRLLDNFNVGDEVSLNIASSPDINNLQMSVTGGTLLIRDGNIPAYFAHYSQVLGGTRQPRTAIGSTKDGKELLLVTVDGRQAGSIGMTIKELAQLMQALGATDAINLDGGGSTTAVARAPGTDSLKVVNTPSESSQRRIENAVGVFSTAPQSELAGLIVETPDDNVFINTSRTFTVRGHDEYFNPVEINSDDIEWSVSGIEGSFKGNVFYPSSVGPGKVKASIGDISRELDITCLSSPVKITLSKTSLNLPLNGSYTFSLRGINKNGYSAKIMPHDVQWYIRDEMGTMKDGIFTAKKAGSGYIKAYLGNTNAYCGLSVEKETSTVLDSFEDSKNSFISYPVEVPGGYELSSEQKYSGNTSGKLSYDFSNIESGSRAAFIVFGEKGLSLPSNAKKLGMWVYTENESPSWLAARVTDSKGAEHIVYFNKGLDWTGWKYMEASLSDISSPASVARVYMVQPNPVADSGCIYVDDLKAVVSSYPAIDTTKIPKDTVPVDESNKSVPFKKDSSSFRFGVFGQSYEPKTDVERSLAAKMASKINSALDAGAFVGGSPHAAAKSLKKPFAATFSEYKAFDVVNSRFIQLAMGKGGLRKTEANQWGWFLRQLDEAEGSNVFIFLAGSPETFSDNLESKLFKDTLTDYKKKSKKNIWVFFEGDKNTSYMENGIKYISTAGYGAEGITSKDTSAAKYVLVTVNGSTVTYEFKPIS
ncbi:uncharacterized protein DUF2233 [Anaerobacterium chartisolvens]|uniref:Uncharacterized protein DUF2233 n=1 Tax=Anaerobacterium chartisolvens TaxID=1297424 RepID=A0A369BHL1_9FIRM|nr:phosphodiester glycosidase family protein [Anaerobacterium chartisolvens]RCX21043.1 uncharacterized protein DUF2233 [Anaerobacterium chartisolvens]